MQSEFTVLCRHPYGRPLGRFDRQALAHGFSLLVEEADPCVRSGHAALMGLHKEYPGRVVIQCRANADPELVGAGFPLVAGGAALQAGPPAERRAPVWAECLDLDAIDRAAAAGYDGLLLRANEAAGRAASLNGFVFFQYARTVFPDDDQ